MAKTRQVRHPATGEMIEAVVVGFSQDGNASALLKLEDGSECQVKVDVFEVVRIPESWDADGHPLYHMRLATMMVVIDSPSELKDPKFKK